MQAQQDSLFCPPLPAAKAAAIRRMGFGTVNKVFAICGQPQPRNDSSVPAAPQVNHLDASPDANLAKPAQQSERRASSYSLLWRLPTNASSDLAVAATVGSADLQPVACSWAMDAEPRDCAATDGPAAALAEESGAVSCSPAPSAVHDSWLRGAYALRLGGSEFVVRVLPVTARASAAADQEVKAAAADLEQLGLLSAGSRQPGGEPDEQRLRQLKLCQDADEQQQEAGEQQAAAMWVAGIEAVAMERRSDAELADDVTALLTAFPPTRQQVPGVVSIQRCASCHLLPFRSPTMTNHGIGTEESVMPLRVCRVCAYSGAWMAKMQLQTSSQALLHWLRASFCVTASCWGGTCPLVTSDCECSSAAAHPQASICTLPQVNLGHRSAVLWVLLLCRRRLWAGGHLHAG